MHKKKCGVLRDRTYERCRNGEIHQSKNYNIQTFLSFLNFEHIALLLVLEELANGNSYHKTLHALGKLKQKLTQLNLYYKRKIVSGVLKLAPTTSLQNLSVHIASHLHA